METLVFVSLPSGLLVLCFTYLSGVRFPPGWEKATGRAHLQKLPALPGSSSWGMADFYDLFADIMQSKAWSFMIFSYLVNVFVAPLDEDIIVALADFDFDIAQRLYESESEAVCPEDMLLKESLSLLVHPSKSGMAWAGFAPALVACWSMAMSRRSFNALQLCPQLGWYQYVW